MGRFDQGSGRERCHTLIARTYGAAHTAPGEFDYNLDTIFQWGRFWSSGREFSILAWAPASDVGLTINRIPLRPRVRLRADATSGDRNPNDQGLQTFNPLFRGTAYSDTIGLIGAANSMALSPNLRFAVSERATVSPGMAFFWRQSTRDGIYGINVAPLRPGGRSRASDVGTLPSVRFDWRISRHLAYTAIYSHFFAGRFLKETPPGEDVNYASTWLTFKFWRLGDFTAAPGAPFVLGRTKFSGMRMIAGSTAVSLPNKLLRPRFPLELALVVPLQCPVLFS